jgi:hypothetical protein
MRLRAMAAALLLAPLLAPAQSNPPRQSPNLELRLQPGKLVNGIPDTFTFIFTNISHHDVRMPKPSNCVTSDTGIVVLRVKVTPEPRSGLRGGCGGWIEGHRPVRDQAKSWPVFRPGESLRVTYSLQQLFFDDHGPATYEFSAEYTPPVNPPNDQQVLTAEGIDFPRERLASQHVIFTRKP